MKANEEGAYFSFWNHGSFFFPKSSAPLDEPSRLTLRW
jgi:hypothetical protein